MSSFNLVKNWLLDSGLMINSESDKNFGGVYSFLDLKTKKYGFLYPEITGYFISSVRFLFHLDNNPNFVNFATASTNWLSLIFKKYDGIIMGVDDDLNKQKLAFTFDTGICSRAMIDCYEMTNDSKYLELSKNLLTWFSSDAINDDGTILPFKDLSLNKFTESKDVWYKQKGCLNIKTAIPFYKLYEITHENEYLNIANKICDSFIIYQQSNGSFSMNENSKSVNLHTQCYALEGLLYGYYITKNPKYFDSCQKALDWCSEHIDEKGSINLWHNSKYTAKASYPTAQLIRIMILFDTIKNESIHNEQISKLEQFLINLQNVENDKKINGGFYEEYYKSIFGWKIRLKLNSWGSMFALQSLYWINNSENLTVNDIKFLY